MTRRALLTGATGYIGGRLASRLVAAGWSVDAITRGSSDVSALPPAVRPHVVDGTIERLRAAVEQARPDVVFHLASLYLADHAPEQVETLVHSNVLLPAQLAQAMVDVGISNLVNTGTASQHFNGAAYDPVSLYAATKQAARDLLEFFHRARGLSVVTLKIFDTYGPDDPRRKILRLLVAAAAAGERLDLSPGEQILDLTHVDDIVEAFLIAAERLLGRSGPLLEDYLLTGERHTLRALAPLVESAVGRRLDARFGIRPYRDREVMVPIIPADHNIMPGWRRRRSLEDTLPTLARAHPQTPPA